MILKDHNKTLNCTMDYKFHHKEKNVYYTLTMNELEERFTEFMKNQPIAYFNHYTSPISATYNFVYSYNGLNSTPKMTEELENMYANLATLYYTTKKRRKRKNYLYR